MSTTPPSPALPTCRHCGEPDPKHQTEHRGLCCDCFDLSNGMPIDALNSERAAQGKPPLPPWRR